MAVGTPAPAVAKPTVPPAAAIQTNQAALQPDWQIPSCLFSTSGFPVSPEASSFPAVFSTNNTAENPRRMSRVLCHFILIPSDSHLRLAVMNLNIENDNLEII